MFRFIVRFFFHNRKRTYQAILTLTLALVIYIATILLVRGYASNISGMATTIQPSNFLLLVENGKSLSESRINQEVYSFLEEYSITTPNVEVILPQIYLPVLVKGETGESRLTHLRLLNFTTFEHFQHHSYTYPVSEPGDNELIMGQHMKSQLTSGVGAQIQIEIENLYVNSSFTTSFIGNYTVKNIIESGHEYDIEILGSIEYFQFNVTLDYYSIIELRVLDTREIETIKEEILDEFNFLEIIEEKQTQNFINYATEEVIQTLTLLQILFFVLMLISITYSIYTLVKESEEEIFILRSIGSTNTQIVVLFMMQALFIGVISAVLSLIVGYLAVSGIVASVSAFIGLPFLALRIDLQLIGVIFLFSVSLSLVSGIYPAINAAKIRVIKEEL
ncbi:MAG: ABC transporter permease [Candidatus Heimdallarchaeota archaeon]|nr:ABC transporter permease [Candidatus Heimdallarchaeota archaeon]MCK4954383.1 ABC transporter permease [Candidatus Heimdallarchaeota archaeon]